MQLTDSVAQSTDGAAQRFEDSCRSAVLQSNNRSVEDTSDMEVGDVFGLSQESNSELLNEIRCPRCLQDMDVACCGNGECRNGTCACQPGKLKAYYYYY